MWLLFFRNTAHPTGTFENTDLCHWAGPFGSDRRGGHQRSDSPLWCQQKQYLSLARATQWLKKTLILSDFVVHNLRPPMEEAMSRLWSQVGWYSKPLRSWNGERRVGSARRERAP